MNRWAAPALCLLAAGALAADGVPADEISFPADAAAYKTGPVLRGTIRFGEGLLPMPGARVRELSGSETLTTGEDGVFTLQLTDEANPAVLVQKEGHVDALQIASAQSRLYFDGEFKIEVFSRADEEQAEREDFGEEWDRSTGRLLLNFQPLGYPAGVRAVLKAPTAEAWVYDANDRATRGSTIGAEPGPGEIVFRKVPPGTWPVEVTAPPGMTCSGPDRLPARADTNTRAYFFCVRDGEEPQTATMGPPAGQKTP